MALYKTVNDFRESLAMQEYWKWPNFTPEELACKCGGRHCGGEYWHDPDVLDMLQAARTAVGKPFKINSAHRCDGHNKDVHGAKNSAHRQIAFDISTHNHDREQLLQALYDAGFTTFGFYMTFVHTDPRPWRLWYVNTKQIWEPIYDKVIKSE